MAGPPSHPKTLDYLHDFSRKSSSSTLSSQKLKTLVHTLIFSQVCRVARALSKAKSILIELLREIQFIHFIDYVLKKNSKDKNKKRLFGSFRLHYNWCSSSHVMPVPSPVLDGFPKNHAYYDSTWNSVISTECEDIAESQLSGYLNWLEEKVHENCKTEEDKNEIDKLADMFIANCHEKFRLEKQESYRMFQEMMARSV
ncbi:uncharacterized protein LOC132315101 [Cornus florida]|uniref:uncharacterized protein LOC132315101 n=1 Tax=Cornus florida TaxID=4283 RepID=UPI0028991794|nr:uncharacterized protein LOC132315101 [Cornus florida]